MERVSPDLPSIRDLRLVRDFARKMGPLRGSLKMTLLTSPFEKEGLRGIFRRSQIPPRPPLPSGSETALSEP